MSDQAKGAGPAGSAGPSAADDAEPHPKGTLLLGVLFLILLAGMWFAMYVTLIGRS